MDLSEATEINLQDGDLLPRILSIQPSKPLAQGTATLEPDGLAPLLTQRRGPKDEMSSAGEE